MPNDARLGLVIGVVLVIVVAVVFFRKELLNTEATPDTGTPSAVNPAAPSATRPARGATRVTPARTTALRRHVVQEGDTLFSLAQHYYGDRDRFVDLYQANRNVLKAPDNLPAGAELVVPELPEEAVAQPDQ